MSDLPDQLRERFPSAVVEQFEVEDYADIERVYHVEYPHLVEVEIVHDGDDWSVGVTGRAPLETLIGERIRSVEESGLDADEVLDQAADAMRSVIGRLGEAIDEVSDELEEATDE